MSRSGLFAMYNNNIDAFSTAASIYYGLFSMQHRGMDASGICINQNGQFKYKKEDGMVIDIFDENVLGRMEGHAGIGHVLYSKRSDVREYAQPIVIRYTNGQMAVALNGGLINTEDLRKELELQGAVFQTSDDAEIISVLISRARNRFETIEEAIADINAETSRGLCTAGDDAEKDYRSERSAGDQTSDSWEKEKFSLFFIGNLCL